MTEEYVAINTAEEVTYLCHLKWFNPSKGFGFVVPEGKNCDVFLHASTLQSGGHSLIGKGAILSCSIKESNNGYCVQEIIEVISSGESVLTKEISNTNQTATIKGTVKWYDEEKEFGFVSPEDNVKDIFIHKSCMNSSDIESLSEGQTVIVEYKTVLKGREALTIKIIETSTLL